MPNPNPEREVLQACPFCQKPGVVSRVDSVTWYVSCSDDECWAAGCTALWTSEAEAIAAWNRRPAAVDAGEDELERVARAISDANWKDDCAKEFLDKQFNDEILQPLFLKQARKAITALNQPTLAEAERGDRTAIVAWLREQGVFRSGLADRCEAAGEDETADDHAARSITYRDAADAIERGDHLVPAAIQQAPR